MMLRRYLQWHADPDVLGRYVDSSSDDEKQIFSVLQAILVFVAISKGFGKTLSDILPLNLIALQKVCGVSRASGWGCTDALVLAISSCGQEKIDRMGPSQGSR